MRPLVGVLLVLACLVLPAAARAATHQRPNIVVVETDDQTVSDLASMPQTRVLIGDRGVYFRQSIVAESQCCPSRATFLTGRYPHNHRVLDTTPPYGGFTAFNPSETLAVWLQRAGYATVLDGKYFNGYGKKDPTYVPPGWTEWHGLWGPKLYQYYGFRLNDDGVMHRYPGQYETNVLTGIAESAIRRRAAAARPLFLWVTYVAPHVGFPRDPLLPPRFGSAIPEPIFTGLFLGVDDPQSPAFNEADVSDKPLNIRRRPRISRREHDFMRVAWRRRQESLVAVDYGVARIVASLKAAHQLRNTLLVFTSDNGYMSGQHRVREGKVLPYEPSIRVPLMFSGAGVPRQGSSSQLVWNGDLAPTILRAAGARAPLPLDGQSIWPFIRDPGLRVPREVLIEGPPNNNHDATPRFTGLRTDRYVYVEYLTGERELYDLRRDPFELRNLADGAARSPLEGRLAARLARLRGCFGDSCHTLPAGLG